MSENLEPLDLYRDHLRGNEPHTLNYKGTNYTFQYHGPELGKSNNWLEVTREDGVARRFGAGHDPELVWRAFHHADTGWEKRPVPPYREESSKDDAWLEW